MGATAEEEEFILHERDYYGLTVVDKYSSGTLQELRESLHEKAVSCFGMLLRNLGRAEVLPTPQDVSVDLLLAHGAEVEEGEATADDLMRKAVENSKEALQAMEAQCLELLNAASVDGSWGLRVVSVKVDSLELADESIVRDLESIAQAQLATKRKQVEGRQQVAAAHVEREAAMSAKDFQYIVKSASQPALPGTPSTSCE